jgi:hypothetical protein
MNRGGREMPQRNVAGQIWPHLAQGTREPSTQRQPKSLGDALWPQLWREAKAKEADQALWDAICERNRQSLLRNLRETRLAMEALRKR